MLVINRDINTEEIVQFPVEDRLIKLPIEKFLQQMNITPSKPQIALINALNDPQYRFVVACFSRRLGKTYIANIIGNLCTLYPNMHVLIISPSYALSSISWDLQKSFYKQFDIGLSKANAKDRVLELFNGSSVRLSSVAQSDSAVGRSYDLIIFDEAAISDGSSAWNVRLRPTLDKLNSKAVFISTPRGDNWFKDLHEIEAEGWVSMRADWLENPRAEKKDIDSAKKSMSYAEWRQEYFADFTVKQGRIYNLPNKCIVEPGMEYETLDTVMGIDLGFRDPTSMVVAKTDGSTWYIVDEYEMAGKTTALYAEAAQKLIAKWQVDFIYIDSANQQMRYDFAVEYDIYCTNAKKEVNSGIGYVQSLVENEKVLVDKNCHIALYAFNNYAWDPREGLLAEKPEHGKSSHMADAIRYCMYSHSHAMLPLDPEAEFML